MILNTEITASPRSRDEPEPVFDTDPVSILIVDDLPDKLLAYKTILEELGQSVVTARSGEEALRMVLRQDFAVILLDVNMPGVDGLETASLIRQRKKSAHTPIIFLTAFTDEIRMAQGYASGAVDYLPTPVDPEILKAKVRVFIELSQMRRQAALQAEEHAMRKAAEELASRLEFMVGASEAFARTRSQTDILQSLIQLPVPYLADACCIFTLEKNNRLKAVSINVDGKVFSELPQAPAMLALIEQEIRQTLRSSQRHVIRNLSSAVLFPEQWAGLLTSATAITVPLTIRDQIHSVFVLVLREDKQRDSGTSLSLANDLTARARIALENAILIEKIKEADRRKDEFLAVLAHELRNPLAPIRNGMSILKLSPDTEVRRQAEQMIERQVEHMIRLVDDLMDVSRITQGKIDLKRQPLKLNDAIHHALETSDPIIRKHRHELKIIMPDDVVWLNADFIRLSQIFSNLLNNAAKYTVTGGRIEVSVRVEGDTVVISVRDNGIGIPENMLENIFEVFSQVDSSLERSQGGLGIGLTLVKNLVELHGGNIKAFSAGKNTGSEFVVTLPVISGHEEEGTNPEQEEEVGTETRKLKVLVVDDSEAAARVMGMMIELEGHEVRLAHSGKAAIECTQTYVPDIILLDIGLPEMNGYETCKIMKANPKLSHSIFVAQTGWGQPEHRKLSQEAGFDHHLVKPVRIHQLQEVIGKCQERVALAEEESADN